MSHLNGFSRPADVTFRTLSCKSKIIIDDKCKLKLDSGEFKTLRVKKETDLTGNVTIDGNLNVTGIITSGSGGGATLTLGTPQYIATTPISNIPLSFAALNYRLDTISQGGDKSFNGYFEFVCSPTANGYHQITYPAGSLLPEFLPGVQYQVYDLQFSGPESNFIQLHTDGSISIAFTFNLLPNSPTKTWVVSYNNKV